MIRLESVLKAFGFLASSRHLQNVFKTSSRCLAKTSSRHVQYVLRVEDVLKTSWQGVLKTYDQDEYIGLDQDVLKTSWRHLEKLVNKNSITWWYVLKAPWKRSGFLRPQGIFKTSSRLLQDVLQKLFQDIFKTSWRRLQNVFKTSSEDVWV